MSEVEEFYRNQALIDSIKNTLINYGYEWHNRTGTWYNENEKYLDAEKKRTAEIGMKKFAEAVKRNDELKKEFDIPC